MKTNSVLFANTSIMNQLRSDTRREHEAIEATLKLFSPEFNRDIYRRVITRFFGYYLPLEAKVWAAGNWGERGINPAQRQKTPLLEVDLQALGVNAPNELPLCERLPTVESMAAAFGCLYVMEGSTLGGQIITKHLLNTLQLTPETGARFFHGYGDRTGPMWEEFRTTLSAFAITSNAHREVIEAALQTFRTLRVWLEADSST